MIKYVIITPVKNEEKFIEKTIASVTSQKILPQEWIIVNDGSTDATKAIVDKYLTKFPWIKKIDLPNQGDRPGEGPARAFNTGFPQLTVVDYDFIVNLDGDVSFESDYFAKIFEKFQGNSKLGIASGKAYYLENERRILYRSTDTTTAGPSKIYRRKCFKDLGSRLVNHICWDMIDDLKANMMGWETRSFNDISFIHLKVQGSRQNNFFKTYFKHGRILYAFGYVPLYVFLKSIYRGFEKPYLVRTLSIPLGYIYAAFKGDQPIIDQDMRNYLKKQQTEYLRKLFLLGKSEKGS